MAYDPDQQEFFEEIGNDLHEEISDISDQNKTGLSEDSVGLLGDDIMNPLPPSDQQS